MGFRATVRVSVLVGINIPGKTLEEALVHARKLLYSDVVRVTGELIDAGIAVAAVDDDHKYNMVEDH